MVGYLQIKLIYWRGRNNSSPIENRHAYFDRVERDGFLLCGARCDNALPAATLALLPLRWPRNTFEAARAALALVFLCVDITLYL